MTTLETTMLIVYPITVGLTVFAFIQWMNAKRVVALLVDEHEEDGKDIDALKKANEEFKAEHENNINIIKQLRNEAAIRERYVREVIQPMIFQRKQKFMELDGICYEMFGIVELITKYPTCINIIPTNLWDQINDELIKQQSFELLRQMQIFRTKYPAKFTKISFGECFYRAPLWNIPNQ